jgi:hypothetical protein
MDVAMWEHYTFNCEIFGCGKVYYSNFIIITNFMEALVTNVRFKNFFPAYFSIEISSYHFQVVFKEFIEHTFQFP